MIDFLTDLLLEAEGDDLPLTARHLRDVINGIEQLRKERDAWKAVADHRRGHSFYESSIAAKRGYELYREAIEISEATS